MCEHEGGCEFSARVYDETVSKEEFPVVYGPVGSTVGVRCGKHAIQGDVNVRERKCVFGKGCKGYPTFQPFNQRHLHVALRCADHSKKSDVCTVSRPNCQFGTSETGAVVCTKTASFAPIRSPKAAWCKTHSEKMTEAGDKKIMVSVAVVAKKKAAADKKRSEKQASAEKRILEKETLESEAKGVVKLREEAEAAAAVAKLALSRLEKFSRIK